MYQFFSLMGKMDLGLSLHFDEVQDFRGDEFTPGENDCVILNLKPGITHLI